MRNFEKFFVNNVENTLGRNSNKLERFSRGGGNYLQERYRTDFGGKPLCRFYIRVCRFVLNFKESGGML